MTPQPITGIENMEQDDGQGEGARKLLIEARDALQLVVEGNPMPTTSPWRADGKWSKLDRCPHDKTMSDGCEACICAVLDPVLEKLKAFLAAEPIHSGEQ